MKNIFLLFIFIFCIKLTNGQSFGKFIIFSKDTKDSVLSNTNIEILNKDSNVIIKVKTDLYGKVEIDSLSEGEYLIKAYRIGYSVKYYSQSININKITFSIIRLETLLETAERIRKENTCDYNMSKKKPKCHICNQKENVIPYSYGLPTKEGKDMAKKDLVRLGGCLVSKCIPLWFCNKDKIDVLKSK